MTAIKATIARARRLGICEAVGWRVRQCRYGITDFIRRARRAWRYLFDRLSADEAQQIAFDCEWPSGFFPLMTLDVERTLERDSATTPSWTA